MLADVAFGLDDAASAPDAMLINVNQVSAEHVAGHDQGWPRVKLARQWFGAGCQRERPASWASRIASATSRMLLREFMLNR